MFLEGFFLFFGYFVVIFVFYVLNRFINNFVVRSCRVSVYSFSSCGKGGSICGENRDGEWWGYIWRRYVGFRERM